MREIRNISDNKHTELYPAHVVLKTGEEIHCALIALECVPPPASWFTKSGWYYLDQVKEIRPSRYAYPYTIARQLMRFIKSKPSEWIYLKDNNNQFYGFDAHAGVFMPEEFTGRIFQLADHNELNNHVHAKIVFEPADRGSKGFWNFTPPPVSVHIWGYLNQ